VHPMRLEADLGGGLDERLDRGRSRAVLRARPEDLSPEIRTTRTGLPTRHVDQHGDLSGVGEPRLFIGAPCRSVSDGIAGDVFSVLHSRPRVTGRSPRGGGVIADRHVHNLV